MPLPIGNCQYDGAGAALQSLYSNTLVPIQTTTVADASRLYSFDQTPFIPRIESSIGDIGYIYIPAACENSEVSIGYWL